MFHVLALKVVCCEVCCCGVIPHDVFRLLPEGVFVMSNCVLICNVYSFTF